MSADRRRAISTPGERADPARRGPWTIAASVAIHVVVIAVLVRVAIVPLHWIDGSRPPEPMQTHVDYVRVPADSGSHRKAGGDNRRVTSKVAPAPLVTPTEVPSELPPEPSKSATPAVPAAPSEGGTGAVIDGGGPTRGVTPQFLDPRLWAPTDPAPVKPKTSTERLDSAIASGVHHVQDSLNALGPQRAAGDWTVKGKDGKQYGIDQRYIHLGNFSIPTALLALLPLNVQGNPATYGESRRIGAMRAEIIEQEARSARDEDFNSAVKELRHRMQEQRAEKAKEDATLPLAPPPPRIVP
ncbi:MAG: hypothetical protein ACREN6_04330 [Gemmatimonadaceae bacterium]